MTDSPAQDDKTRTPPAVAPPASPQAMTESPPTSSAKKKAAGTSPDGRPVVEPVKARRRLIWACVWGFVGVNFLMFLRFFFPRALFEPKTIFTVGTPPDFSFGVETKFQQEYRIWVVKKPDRLFVIYARCTHLGCTPDWKESENKFKCPCHGSGYDSDGINFEGPAPRPMDRAYVELNAQGQVVVDVGRLFKCERGKRCEFDDGDGRSGAYLTV